MSLYRRKNSQYWWYKFPNPHGGRPIRESTGQTDKRKAQEVHDQKKAEFWKVKITGRTFYDALGAWVEAEDRSINDLNAVKLIQRLYPNRPLTEVTGDSIEQAFGDRMIKGRKGQKTVEKKKVSAGTYNKLANIARAAMNIAVYPKKWIKSFDKIPRKKEPKSKAKYITKEQFEMLLSKLAEHQRPLFMFALATGWRWSNVTYLEWSRVDLKQRIAWVDAEEAKGDEDIPAPLSEQAMQVLIKQIGKDDRWVFPMPAEFDKRKKHLRGTPIGSPKTAFNRARNEAGLSHFNWHGIRHTWASWHAMSGTPLEVIQELGKWKDPKMVKRYAKLAKSYLAKFADNARPYESNVVEIKRKRRA